MRSVSAVGNQIVDARPVEYPQLVSEHHRRPMGLDVLRQKIIYLKIVVLEPVAPAHFGRNQDQYHRSDMGDQADDKLLLS